jgi:hypothetical protein
MSTHVCSAEQTAPANAGPRFTQSAFVSHCEAPFSTMSEHATTRADAAATETILSVILVLF